MGLREEVEKNLAQREEIRTVVEKAPMPMEGKPPWEITPPATLEEIMADDYTGPTEAQWSAYQSVAESLARAMLICADDDPALAVSGEALYAAACERFPGLHNWLGGPSGAQFGWAVGAVKVIHGREEPDDRK